ncbi:MULTISPECIES: 2Fe-2S iron-sulfur cluster-binding protein [unclassified Shinella]|uniref:2Fe-2S iron-sulfur cluster-binding protein n=1 Tax=unclassified Shinella TaxID=2643062 RepID=UPI00225CB3A6|nr:MULTISPECIES: 2Fe-2S iron-sulfur cluster-binding protein [unclassified Shinella]MCO5137619.1 2Fe-2S iron-sulfur cluster-binding protein [Shinella sp.]MDC7257737.1 (2Fe-2S)-binding protein [Shinella sp. YE25]CAI0335519.1 Sarcosine oxidase alpha subunit [Rhizobiaceae bacterium]CAK7259826.1 Sarcosine oxidase subunit alpha family protein [Shinella sp. WSC3-e]
MTAWRTEGGTAIDRSRPLAFTFDGKAIDGFAGDTVASALLAGGVSVLARSFKYHRPRGLWGAGVEEPNALVDIAGGLPNTRATQVPAADGLVVRSVNAEPNAEKDRHAFLDAFSRFIPAAFYYKTFMFPDWHLFEPRIRQMAGLGTLDEATKGPAFAEQVNQHCDVLVVGAGPSGLLAARKAARAGKRVVLCDDGRQVGGSLLFRAAAIEGKPGAEWAADVAAELERAGVRVLTGTTAFGIYDHHLVGLHQKAADGAPDRLWRIRAGSIVLAAGAIERPLPFGNNDLPGVMSAEAALVYLRRFGVAAGRKVVIAANNGLAYETAEALAAAGADVTVVDYRADAASPSGLRVLKGLAVVTAVGRSAVTAVKLSDGTVLEADALLASGGFTPTVHLYCQAQGKLDWRDDILAFVPGRAVDGVEVVGAAAGNFGLPAELAGGSERDFRIVAAWPKPGARERVWIDLQNDVTAKDVELAVRENFVSVEHLKRYTTLGMATDQGKTSNVNGLALMAELTGRRIPEVGTTTYRPPFTPVPLASFAGARSGTRMNPLRRLPLEAQHRADGAVFREYGGWLRPAFYGAGAPEERIQAEAQAAREGVALFDGSPLGKIEVMGPDAAPFLDFIYYNTVSTLAPGRCRYGFILTEAGNIYDDGVLMRLDENRFVVSCSSSHVAGVHGLLEEWRQDRFDKRRVFIHNVTAEMATLTVTGPRARALVESAGLSIALDDAALPHMAVVSGLFDGIAVRIARVSFTGDRSYEISVSADQARALWARLRQAGEACGATLLGLEALMILRAEKGYIVIGKDTDGTSRPMDFGLTAPLERKKVAFIGRRSLITEDAAAPDRRQFVGLEAVDGKGVLPTGAHGIERKAGATRSLGYVTSSYFSPVLRKPIALGLIERGLSRMGDIIELQHLRDVRQARIVPSCAFDEEGARLHA